MKIIKLNETFLNFWGKDKKKKEQYVDEVMDILEKSYEKIGGPHTDKEELLQDNIYWKLVRRGDHISAVSVYKDQGPNRKLMVCGQDFTEQGKADLKRILKDDVDFVGRGAYGEVSEAVEHIMIDYYNAKKIPAEVAAKILANQPNPKKILSIEEDGYHYKRKIGDEVYTKLMVGDIPEQFV